VLSKPSYVYRNNRATHVLLTVDEYEQLANAAEAQQLIAKLEDPTTKWIPAEEAFVQIAGGWIADARKRAGLTQKQLADKMGMPQSQISRIEKNPDRTTMRTMKRIAAALEVDISALLSFASKAR
jgi:ribosome-binding protein aMBF1 (putative translation factor)